MFTQSRIYCIGKFFNIVFLDQTFEFLSNLVEKKHFE